MISSNNLLEVRLTALKDLSEWRKLLKHFKFAPDLFAFIPVFVPDSDWADVCRQSLAESLRALEKKELYVITLEKPEELKNLAVTIFDLELEKKKYGAVWIAAPVTLRDHEREDWLSAWREGMGQLNQYRNPFRRKFDFPVLLVGAEWTQQIIRDAAPDLWSVRTIVVRIEPPALSAIDVEKNEKISATRSFNFWRNVDPEFALREATRLRGQTGKELGLARLLIRAARGFNARAKFKQALEAAQEADGLVSQLLTQATVTPTNNKDNLNRSELESFWAGVLNTKGIALDDLGKLNEAILEYDKAIEIRQRLIEEENRNDLANDLAIVFMNKGNTLSDLGKLNEAILEHDKAIEIYQRLIEDEKQDDLANYLARAFMIKGVALKNLGKLNEAIDEYDKAIEIYQRLIEDEKQDDLVNDLAGAFMNKGNALESLGKLNEAILEHDKAIEIYQRLIEDEKQDDLVNDLAKAFMNKGNALNRLGKLNEAIDEYDKSERVRKGCLQLEDHVLPEFVRNIRNRVQVIIKLENWERTAEDAIKAFEIYEQVELDNDFSDYFKQQISEQLDKILYFLREVSPGDREKIYAAAGDKGEFLRQFVESNQ